MADTPYDNYVEIYCGKCSAKTGGNNSCQQSKKQVFECAIVKLTVNFGKF